MTAKPTDDPSVAPPAAGVTDVQVCDVQVSDAPGDGSRRALSPAAMRALAEAEARRTEIDRKSSERPEEVNGRGGADPARYGDWEVKGIASDF